MNDRADGLLGGFVVKKLNGGNGSVAELGEGQEVPIGREYYTIVQASIAITGICTVAGIAGLVVNILAGAMGVPHPQHDEMAARL